MAAVDYQRFGPEAVEVAHAEPIIDRGQPAEPQWSSGLFDCLLDLRTSAAVLCCMPTTTAQIFTRVSGGRNPANLCVVLAVLLWLCVLAVLCWATMFCHLLVLLVRCRQPLMELIHIL